ncbi:MAG: Gfo/Idh/MocA family oxidoreductase [Thermoleophilia bacterium]|jgi:predicted dehydrogenase|nr:Gfo/Idh/MocA family oxidoreductase [Thermoleophilia bacterium]
MTISVGLVGLGYWGPNLARNLQRSPNAELRWLCDLSTDLHDKHRAGFPEVKFTTDFDEMLADDTLDAIVIASPVPTHHALGLRALRAGKHTFIEKPIALTAEHARELLDVAEASDLRLMVGHLLEYHPAVLRMRDMIESGELGDVLYAYSNRLNLGQFRRDENALWSLGVHDVATLMFLLGDTPVEVGARGESYVHDGVEDVVFGDMKFAGGTMAHIHLSWLDPHKVRRLTVVGSQQMAVFDDMEAERKLTLYDKGFTRQTAEEGSGSWGEYVAKREGDISIPRLPADEPLKLEVEHFLECVRTGATPRSDGRDGLRVVQVLEGMQKSLENGGNPVTIGEAAGV